MIPYPRIHPIFLEIGPFALRWYGLMYALAFLSATFFIRKVAVWRRVALTSEQISDLVFSLALGVILGGRLGYVLIYNPTFYLSHPLSIVAIWEGGMAFHGGLIGAIVAGAIFCACRKLRFYEIADVTISSVPIGLGLGRMGNFINGELVGRPTTVPWCMVFPEEGPLCRHPSQLYQVALEGFLLWVILYRVSRQSEAPGVPFWSFFVFYGLFRSFVEHFRQPDVHLGLFWETFSMGQLLSLPMILVGLVMILRCKTQSV